MSSLHIMSIAVPEWGEPARHKTLSVDWQKHLDTSASGYTIKLLTPSEMKPLHESITLAQVQIAPDSDGRNEEDQAIHSCLRHYRKHREIYDQQFQEWKSKQKP